jgi:hypothetical protein
MRKHHLDPLFLIPVHLGSKFCPCVLEIVGLAVPAWHIRYVALFNFSSCKNVPLLDEHQLLMFAGTLTSSEPLIVFILYLASY